MKVFEDLEEIVAEHYSNEDQYIISCPSQEQVNVMYVDVQGLFGYPF